MSADFTMVTQLGLSPTSTLADVKTVLQNAIAQEQATIESSRQLLLLYQQQLQSLTALTSSPDASLSVESAPESNGAASGSITNGDTPNASASAALLSAQPSRKRTRGQSAKSRQSESKTDAPTEAATTAPPTPADLPKLLKRFRGQTIPEAIGIILSEHPEQGLDYKEITALLYGAAVLKDEALQKKLPRTVAPYLIRGAASGLWKKEGLNPTLYQCLLPSEVSAAAKP